MSALSNLGYCTACGSVLGAGARFCAVCGSKVEGDQPPDAKSTGPSTLQAVQTPSAGSNTQLACPRGHIDNVQKVSGLHSAGVSTTESMSPARWGTGLAFGSGALPPSWG